MLPWSQLAWTQGFWDDPSACCAQWFSAWRVWGTIAPQYWVDARERDLVRLDYVVEQPET